MTVLRGMDGCYCDAGSFGMFGARGSFNRVWGFGISGGVGASGISTSVTYTEGCTSPTFILVCR